MQRLYLVYSLIFSGILTCILTLLLNPRLGGLLIPVTVLPHGAIWFAARRFPARSRAHMALLIATVLLTLANGLYYGIPVFEAFAAQRVASQVYSMFLVLIPIAQLCCLPIFWYIAKFLAWLEQR